ncbi:L(+)-tartrate dehydratase subunit alpha [uncultured Clostridium sp.]|nr:L(+)-tartrate dehydratase subunit alpha [uncultured Clostridium sp.]
MVNPYIFKGRELSMLKAEEIKEKISNTIILAGSTFRQDKIAAYQRAIAEEKNENSKWVLETILENALAAEKAKSPLCDDTGIPHVFIEIGKNRSMTGEMLEIIMEGIEDGLEKLPGRPMAICGNDSERISQAGRLSPNPGAVLPAPYLIKQVEEDVLRVHIIMQGGGPAIRATTYRVFHKHSVDVVAEEIISRASEAVKQLGCTPCTLAVGVGRSHFEAASLMMEAQVYGTYDRQNELEKKITDGVNKGDIGPLGLGGKSVLATFLKVGPQRASGVRIVCIRPCCCFEPRISSVEL